MNLLRKLWFRFLKLRGYSVFSIHKKSIVIIEEKFSQLNDDEHLIMIQMLDDGYSCSFVSKKLHIARKNRSLKRKLKELEIKETFMDYLLDKYSIIIDEKTNVDELVNKVNQEYLMTLEKNNILN